MRENERHYNKTDFETIDVIEDITKNMNGGLAFCIGNAIKYISRCMYKGSPVEDLDKAIWYLERAKGKIASEDYRNNICDSGEHSKTKV